MELLDGFLAFALSLAALATVVTVLTEAVHRTLRLRAKGLSQMLINYFEQALQPELMKQISDVQTIDRLKSNFVSTLVDNPLRTVLMGTGFAKVLNFVVGPLTKYDEVTLREFVLRLPDSDAYKSVLSKLPKLELAEKLREMAARYIQHEDAVTDYFKRRAQLLSILAGIGLPLVANIDGLRLYEAFVNNRDLRERMIGRMDEIGKQIGATSTAIGATPLSNPTAGKKEDVAAGGPTPKSDPTKVEIDKIKDQLQSVRTTLVSYAQFGLPIGWSYYPNCFVEKATDPKCVTLHKRNASLVAEKQPCGFDTLGSPTCKGIFSRLVGTAEIDTGGFLQWLFVVVVTGALMGLGAPFWFDIAASSLNSRAAPLPTRRRPRLGIRRRPT